MVKPSTKCHFQARLKKGLALVPEDRQGEGVVQMMSIQSNMTLSDFSLQGFAVPEMAESAKRAPV